jgi:hypothetical protein
MSVSVLHQGVFTSTKEITLSGETDVNGYIYVGTQGDIDIKSEKDNSFSTFKNFVGFMPGYVKSINAATTTADDIVRLG